MAERMRISLFRPAFDEAEIDAVKEVLESGWWASGPKTEEFEYEFRKIVDCEEVIAVNSGTSAITLLLDYLDIKGKEVLTPAITFVGVVHAIVQNGGIPVFVDVGPDLCMDVQNLLRKTTRESACIIPMHYGGRICDMKGIREVADYHQVPVIEDACHAHGSIRDGKPAGSFGDYSFFSFHAVKPVAMPNGGCICLNRTGEEADELRSKRNFGIVDRRGPMYEVRYLGYNMYMNDVSAAVGLVQLDKLHDANTGRREIAATYVKELRNLEWVRMLPFDQGSSYHLFPVLAERPDSFVEWMNHRGVECGAHYPRIDEFEYYLKRGGVDYLEWIGEAPRQRLPVWEAWLELGSDATRREILNRAKANDDTLYRRTLKKGIDQIKEMGIWDRKPGAGKYIYASYIEKSKTCLQMTEELSDKIVTIPCHPGLSKEDVNYIIESVKMHCNVG